MTSWGWCIDIVDVDVDVPDGMEVALVGLAGLSSIRISTCNDIDYTSNLFC